jgi:hypothetical protein
MPDVKGVFQCNETPLTVSPIALYNTTKPYKSYYGKLNIPTVGPMYVSLPPTGESGILLEESTQITYTKNGVVYNLFETRIYIPGLHNHQGGVGDGELLFFFKNLTNDILCLCVPLFIDDQKGANYFSKLTKGVNLVVKDKVSLRDIFDFNSFDGIEYRGADVRKRTLTSSTPANLCDNLSYVVTYILIRKNTFIKQVDFDRIKGYFTNDQLEKIKGPVVTTIFNNGDIFNQLTPPVRLCKNITITGTTPASARSTKPALKCFPIDESKNIKDGEIVLDESEENSEVDLQKELKQLNLTENIKSSYTMDSIETIIGILIGVVIGGVILVLIGYNIIRYLSKKKYIQTITENVVKTGGAFKPYIRK